MYCIDFADGKGKNMNMNLFGTGIDTPHRHFEIIYRPCDPVNDHLSESTCQMDDPTNKTQLAERLEYTKKWLGDLELKIIYN